VDVGDWLSGIMYRDENYEGSLTKGCANIGRISPPNVFGIYVCLPANVDEISESSVSM
jgi:hypothetical protein